MIVLNLGIDAHKVVDDVNGSGGSGFYGASKRMMSSKQQETTEKTVLTEEQKKYLEIYENEHDRYFKSGNAPVPQDEAKQDKNTATDNTNEVLPNEEVHHEESGTRKFFSSLRNIFKKKREEKK